MKIQTIVVSSLALFGLFSALVSFVPVAPRLDTSPHALFGCDPGIPGFVLSKTQQVPLNFYTQAEQQDNDERYTISFFPPKTMGMEMSDSEGTQSVPFRPKTLHEVSFRYDTVTKKMGLRLDPDVSTTGGELDFEDIPFLGSYNPAEEAAVPTLIDVPHPADNKKRKRFVVQFKGLTTGFRVSDQ